MMSDDPNPETLKTIQSHAFGLLETLVEIRRDLHMHPELSGEEGWTASYIADRLNDLPLDIHTGIGGHGIVADLVTDPGRPMVALRVDMDALPIQEINAVPYRSQVPGVMHACGHDVHSAIGIGTAVVLSRMAADLPGNIRFIFQPEEEQITGALGMLYAGALAHPLPVAIFGLHVAPLPVGKVAWAEDLFLAGFDHYLVSLSPQEGYPLTLRHLHAAARRCCQVIKDFNDWQLPVTWEEMGAFWEVMQDPPENLRKFIIYDASLDDEEPSFYQGQFGLGIKAADPHLRRAALGRVRAALNPICRVRHIRYHIEPMGSMPDVRNDRDLVQATLPALQVALGEKNLIHLGAAFPFNCEDFAFFAERIPGAMVWLGAADPVVGKYAMLHTADFDVDERCLVTGVTAMAVLLRKALLTHPF
jgi:metal-dependent amidase/aminoacylase/carboxypeptidase family protein